MSKRSAAYQNGLWAEFLVASYFFLRGYRIMAQRYKTRHGEIDLVLKRGQSLVFVEVKSRSSIEAALESVGHKNRRRIENAARQYISHYPEMLHYDMRFTVVGVVLLWNFFPKKFVRVDNAWFSGA